MNIDHLKFPNLESFFPVDDKGYKKTALTFYFSFLLCTVSLREKLRIIEFSWSKVKSNKILSLPFWKIP